MTGLGTKRRTQRADATWSRLVKTYLPTVAIAAMLAGSSLRGLTQFLEAPRRIDVGVEIFGLNRWHPLYREWVATRVLYLDARPEDGVVLQWREADEEDRSITLGKREVIVRDGTARRVTYPDLGPALAEEWRNHGLYTDPVDVRRQRLVLVFANDLPCSALIGLLDAVSSVTRPSPRGGPPECVFDVRLSAR